MDISLYTNHSSQMGASSTYFQEIERDVNEIIRPPHPMHTIVQSEAGMVLHKPETKVLQEIRYDHNSSLFYGERESHYSRQAAQKGQSNYSTDWQTGSMHTGKDMLRADTTINQLGYAILEKQNLREIINSLENDIARNSVGSIRSIKSTIEPFNDE